MCPSSEHPRLWQHVYCTSCCEISQGAVVAKCGWDFHSAKMGCLRLVGSTPEAFSIARGPEGTQLHSGLCCCPKCEASMLRTFRVQVVDTDFRMAISETS